MKNNLFYIIEYQIERMNYIILHSDFLVLNALQQQF